MKKTIWIPGFCLMVVATLWVAPAEGHHIRGIPHYSYRSNYPETPVYETIEHTDRYIVTFTYYRIPGQQALDLAIYIRDSLNNEPFAEPVTFLVFGKHEAPEDSHPFTAYRNPTNVYKVGWVYEDDGDYYVRVTFSDSTITHNTLFELTVGDEDQVWYLLGGSVGLVLLFAVVVGVLRRKQLGEGRGA